MSLPNHLFKSMPLGAVEYLMETLHVGAQALDSGTDRMYERRISPKFDVYMRKDGRRVFWAIKEHQIHDLILPIPDKRLNSVVKPI